MKKEIVVVQQDGFGDVSLFEVKRKLKIDHTSKYTIAPWKHDYQFSDSCRGVKEMKLVDHGNGIKMVDLRTGLEIDVEYDQAMNALMLLDMWARDTGNVNVLSYLINAKDVAKMYEENE